MKSSYLIWGIGLLCLSATVAQGGVIITEIMYNPVGGADGVLPPSLSSEWVEIYNKGSQTVDISGWRLDDEDADDWGPLPAGSFLMPGEAAVIAATDLEFQQTWGSHIKVFKVIWGQLANAATATNEILALLDNNGAEVNQVNFQTNANGWPPGPNGPSIYLTDFNLDNNVGANWAVSVSGVDGAYIPASPVAPYGAPTTAVDIGSPGFVVPEPSSVLLVALAFVATWNRRDRKRPRLVC